MPLEGVCTEATGPSTYHQLRAAAWQRERPYGGWHPIPCPLEVAAQIADLYGQAAAEAERMGWPELARMNREDEAAWRKGAEERV